MRHKTNLFARKFTAGLLVMAMLAGDVVSPLGTALAADTSAGVEETAEDAISIDAVDEGQSGEVQEAVTSDAADEGQSGEAQEAVTLDAVNESPSSEVQESAAPDAMDEDQGGAEEAAAQSDSVYEEAAAAEEVQSQGGADIPGGGIEQTETTSTEAAEVTPVDAEETQTASEKASELQTSESQTTSEETPESQTTSEETPDSQSTSEETPDSQTTSESQTATETSELTGDARETAEDWEKDFANVVLTDNWRENLVNIALTQVGYEERQVADGGELKRYSRYGEWYGSPYEDWCAMFISFCLYYAKIPTDYFPQESSCSRWVTALQQSGLYKEAASYTPKPGDVVFFYVDGAIGHAGIVENVDDTTVYTVEGNADGRVQQLKYALDDAGIAGYGSMEAAMVRAGVLETEAQTTEAETEAQTTEAETEAQTTEAETEAQTTEAESESNTSSGPRRQARIAAQSADEEDAETVTVTAQILLDGTDEEKAQMLQDLQGRSSAFARYALYRKTENDSSWTQVASQEIPSNSTEALKVSFTEQPKTDNSGNAYSYNIKSADFETPAGYVSDCGTGSVRQLTDSGNMTFTETWSLVYNDFLVTVKLLPAGDAEAQTKIKKDWKEKDVSATYTLWQSVVGYTGSDKNISKSTASAANDWTVRWYVPAVNSYSKTYLYKVARTSEVPSGYTSNVITGSNLAGQNYTFTETWTPVAEDSTATVWATITWDDYSDQLGYRSTVEQLKKILLLNYGDESDKRTAASITGSGNTYTATWENVPTYYNGQAISGYTFDTAGISGHYKVTQSSSSLAENTLTFTLPAKTYTVSQKIDITITETMANMAGATLPESVTATLLIDGQEATEAQTSDCTYSFTPGSSGWSGYKTHSFVVPTRDAAGKDISSSIGTLSASWSSAFEDFGKNVTIITSSTSTESERTVRYNRIPIYSMVINWEDAENEAGVRPERLTLQVLANSTPLTAAGTYTFTPAAAGASQTLNIPPSAWYYLPRYDKSGATIDYTLGLVGDSYYRVKKSTLTNSGSTTLTLAMADYQTVTAKVEWNNAGSDGESEKRPSSVNLTLYYRTEGGEWQKFWGQSEYVVTSGDQWTYEWTHLPAKDATGNNITYKVGQEEISRYTVQEPVIKTSDEDGIAHTEYTLAYKYNDNWDYYVNLYWDSTNEAEKYDKSVVTTDTTQLTATYILEIGTQKDTYKAEELRVQIPLELFNLRSSANTGVTPTFALGAEGSESADFSFTYRILTKDTADTSDDIVEFYNYKDLVGATNFKTEVTYSFKPADVCDTSRKELQATASGKKDGAENAVEQTTAPITYSLDTGVVMAKSPEKEVFEKMYYWNTNYYGPAPDDLDMTTYDYVCYKIQYYWRNNQPFNITFTEQPSDNGKVVGYRSSFLYASSNYSTQPLGSATDNGNGIYTWTIPTPSAGYGSEYLFAHCYVVVRYPKKNVSSQPESQVTRTADYANSATVTYTASDPAAASGEDYNDTAQGNCSATVHWTDYEFTYTGSDYSVSKGMRKNSSGGEVTALEYGQDVTGYYYVNTNVYGYNFTDPDYQVEIGDDAMYAAATIGGSTKTYVPLGADDYEFSGTPVMYVETQRTERETGQKTDGVVPKDAFVLYGKKADGNWYEIGSAKMTSSSGGTNSSWLYGTKFIFEDITGKGYIALKLKSPTGEGNWLKDYFTSRIECNYTLKGTSTVVKQWLEDAEAAGQEVTGITLQNFAYVRLYDSNGNWINARSYSSNSMSYQVGLDRKDKGELGSYLFRANHHVDLSAAQKDSNLSKLADQITANATDQTLSVRFTAAAYESISTNKLSQEVYEAFSEETGVFYDLLPLGYSLDESKAVSVYGANGGIDEGWGAATRIKAKKENASLTSVTTQDDYKGTGRQLVTFKVKHTGTAGQNYLSYDNKMYTGFIVQYYTKADYEDITRGATSYNTVAYQRGDQAAFSGSNAYTERGYGSSDSTIYYPMNYEETERALFNVSGKYDENKTNTLYAYEGVSTSFGMTYENGLHKYVKGNSGIYQKEDITDLSGDYSYKIRLQTSSNGKTKNVVIFDDLEEAANTNEATTAEQSWKGSFKSVDVKAARNKGINVQVYYSTSEDFQYNDYNQANGVKLNGSGTETVVTDLDTSLWSTTAPSDPSKVTALAFDLSKATNGDPYVFEADEVVELVIHMTAPDHLTEGAEYAYNRPAYYSTLVTSGATTENTSFNISNRVLISLRDLKDFTFYKLGETVSEKSTASGEPEPLSGMQFSLYQLTCTNTDASHTHNMPGSSSSCWGTSAVKVAYSNEDGKVTFSDLDTGEYAIVENTSRTGYVQPSSCWWTFTVDATKGSVTPPETYTTSSSVTPVKMELGSGTYAGSYTLLNSRRKRNIYINKIFKDDSARIIRPEKLTFELYRNGIKVAEKEVDAGSTASGSSTQVAVFTDLFAYDEHGTYYTYEVREKAVEGYTADSDSISVSGNTSDATVTFSNSRLGTMDIRKQVSGSTTTQEFGFTVKLSLPNAEEKVDAVNGDDTVLTVTGRHYAKNAAGYTTETFEVKSDGKLTFKLKDGEHMILLGIPLGTGYTVTETESQGYVSKVTGGTSSGTLTTSGTTGAVTFTNTPQPAKLALPVKKTINGDSPEGVTKTFTFVMESVSGKDADGNSVAVPMPDPTSVDITGASEGAFQEITYTQAGTYVYTVHEREGSAPGYTYNTSKRTVTVTVEDNNGTLTATAKDTTNNLNTVITSENPLTINNTYQVASTSLQLEVSKQITGNERPADARKDFTISIEKDGVNAFPDGVEDADALPSPSTLTITDTGVVGYSTNFTPITYKKAGIYKYKVTETVPTGGAPTGYTYDTSVYYVTVTVTDNDGRLEAAPSYQKGDSSEDTQLETASAISFSNKYEPQSATLSLSVAKAYSTTTARPDSQTFSFLLSRVKPTDAPLPKETKAEITTDSGSDQTNENWKATFGSITFTAAGTYVYTLQEETGSAAGYSYDATPRTLTVKVTDTDGQLSVSSLAIDGNDVSTLTGWTYNSSGSTASACGTFTNTYEPTKITLTLPVKKEIRGSARPEGKAEKFSFTIEAESAVDATGNTIKTVPMPGDDDAHKTISIQGAGESSFAAITYTQAGTYTYKVKEDIPATKKTGYTYDETEHTIVVTVTDLGGQLGGQGSVDLFKSWTVDGEAADYILFTNEYHPTEARVTLPVKKTVDGDVPSGQEQEFTFTLTAGENTAGSSVATPMPAASEGSQAARSASTASLTIKGSDSKSFNDITYTEAGTYYYTLQEVEPTGADKPAGYSYDTGIRNIAVKVTDNDGVLSASVTADSVTVDAANPMEFKNTYEPESVYYELPVKKVISGSTPPSEQKFWFQLSANGNDTISAANTPLPSGESSRIFISGSGQKSFARIHFTKAGTYTYTLAEEKPDPLPSGYTCDGQTYTINITVTDQNGRLSVTSAIALSDRQGSTEHTIHASNSPVTFTNSYQPTETTVTIPVEKTVTSATERASSSYGFTFRLKAESAPDGVTAPMPAGTASGEDATVHISDEGKVDFPAITFTVAGDYQYELVEDTLHEPGYSYDRTPRKIQVHVADEDGKLTATWTSNDEKVDEVVINNTYSPDEIRVVLPVQKVIEGNQRTESEKKTFTFTIQAVTEDAPMPEGTVVYIRDAASRSFAPITFKKAGTYIYTVTETNSGESGYIYDSQLSKKVTVNVEDNGDGKLSATWTVNGDPASEIVFTNRYAPTAARLALKVTKSVTGNGRPAGELRTFNFNLTAQDGAPNPTDGVMTVSVTDDGTGNAQTVSFGEIVYTTTGTYRYTVYETVGDKPGYTYDTASYTVTVTVTDDNGDGVLEAKAGYTAGGESMGSLAFTNKYKPTAATLELPVEKQISGQTRPAGKEQTFRFQIEAKTEGAPMPAGSVVSLTDAEEKKFGAITYEKAGTYEYKISEIAPDSAPTGYGYDTGYYMVTVAVTDKEGVLTASPTVTRYEADNTQSTSQPGKAVFTNTYQPTQIKVTIPVVKYVKNTTTSTLAEETFTFKLSADTAGAPQPAAAAEDDKEEAEVMLLSDEPEAGGSSATLNITGTGPSTATTGKIGEAGFEITFTAAGTYVYTLQEVSGSHPGYSIDSQPRKVKIVVTDKGGTLSAEWTVDDESMEKVAFTNTYDPKDLEVYLPVRKIISGNARPEDGEKTFRFRITALGTENGKTAAQTPMPVATVVRVTGADQAAFGPITYTEEGVYTYEVEEILPDGVKSKDTTADGYTWDTWDPDNDGKHIVVVTVTNENGVLSRSWTVDGKTVGTNTVDGTTDGEILASIRIENQYDPKDAALEIPVTKTVEGDVPSGKAQEFTFTLTAVEATADGQTLSAAQMPLPKNEKDEAVTSIDITGAGESTFPKITFTQAGTYRYTLSETDGKAAGYAYDTKERSIVVTVTDKGGELSASYTVDGAAASGVSFKNTYDPVDAYVQLQVEKTVAGSLRPDGEHQTFEFTLAAGVNDAGVDTPMPHNAVQTITDMGTKDWKGSKDFGLIQFTKAGTYHYTLTETDGRAHGYTYAKAKDITVTVADDNGTLKASVAVKEQGASDADAANYEYGSEKKQTTAIAGFTNTYKPDEKTISIPVEKALTGNSLPEDAAAQEFRFLLTAGANSAGNGVETPMPGTAVLSGGKRTAEAVVTGTGTDSTSLTLTFKEAGVYHYTLQEEEPAEAQRPAGYSYNTAVRDITVTVTDQGGKLSAAWKVDNDTMETVKTTNSYSPSSVKENFTVVKTVAGNQRPAGSEQTFTFTLVPGTNTSAEGVATPMPTNATETDGIRSSVLTITGDGANSFGDITFTAAGTYEYTITEVQPETVPTGYTWDPRPDRKVTVTVTDKDGALTATVTSDGKANTPSVYFTNTYAPGAAELTLQVEKKITGSSRSSERKFTFLLTAVDNAPMPSGITDGESAKAEITGEGTAKFAKLTWSETGTWTYKVTEQNDHASGYTYDKEEYTVKVTVTDRDGTLTPAVTISRADGSEAGEKEIVFTNNYTYNPPTPTPPSEEQSETTSETETETTSETETETTSETETESGTEAETETGTETEPSTETETEPQTDTDAPVTEPETEPPTERPTEAPTEVLTERPTEKESGTETESESGSESESESESESDTESESGTEKGSETNKKNNGGGSPTGGTSTGGSTASSAKTGDDTSLLLWLLLLALSGGSGAVAIAAGKRKKED